MITNLIITLLARYVGHTCTSSMRTRMRNLKWILRVFGKKALSRAWDVAEERAREYEKQWGNIPMYLREKHGV